MGEVENRGFEGLIFVMVFCFRDFIWDVGFNFFINWNKIIFLVEGVEIFRLGGIFGGNGFFVEVCFGEDYGIIMGWDYIYYDENSNGIMDFNEIRFDNCLIDENGVWY